MKQVYARTENGTATEVSVKEALAEVNAAMTDGKDRIRSMSSQYGRHDITYTDGRRVLLVLVQTSEEGFTTGEAVTVERPGQPPRTGTVAHLSSSPGFVAVLDDRSGSVQGYPVRFVTPVPKRRSAKVDEQASQDPQEWSGTKSSFQHLHRFTPEGRARCSSRIRPLVWSGQNTKGVVLHTRAEIEGGAYAHLYTFCPRCQAKP